MLVTTLDANVATEKWDELRTKFKHMAENIPDQIVETMLMQNPKEPDSWKVITVWRGREEFAEYRKSLANPVPEGIALFRSVGSEPVPAFYEVLEHSNKK